MNRNPTAAGWFVGTVEEVGLFTAAKSNRAAAERTINRLLSEDG